MHSHSRFSLPASRATTQPTPPHAPLLPLSPLKPQPAHRAATLTRSSSPPRSTHSSPTQNSREKFSDPTRFSFAALQSTIFHAQHKPSMAISPHRSSAVNTISPPSAHSSRSSSKKPDASS